LELDEREDKSLVSMQHFRFAYNKIVQYRDTKMEKGLDAKKDLILPFS